MNATKFWAALLLTGACACTVHAQQTVWCAPALQRPLGTAPDACGPGFYAMNCYGAWYGPNYYLYPWFPPESGIGLNQALSGKMPTPNGGPGYGQGNPYGGYGPGKIPQNPYPNGLVPPGAPYPPGMTPYAGMYPNGMPFPPKGAMQGMPPYNMPVAPTPAAPGSVATPPNLPSLPNPGPPYQQGPGKQQPTFISHPWTRSPRDFYMWNEVVEDQAKRFPLPVVVP
jgi:hypothetical protein